MTAKKQGLQKLTETEKKITTLLAKNKIHKSEVFGFLNNEEMNLLGALLTKKLNESKGDARDVLLNQISDILPEDTKNQLWENNHYQIVQSMTKLIDEFGKMPTKNAIASDTGLSRQTVYKHLNGFATHPLYIEQLQQFKFMADRVLGKVIKAASLGDMKAARLYFDVIGNLNTQTEKKVSIKKQNNFIQINGTILSQETIKQLNEKQINKIEAILKTAIPIGNKS